MKTNLFEAVKESVTTREAAERYGLHVKRNGMCVCPFHNDKNPSMKVDKRYHCFGCQADGDVISFTARLLQLAPKEAANQLAHDFGITNDASLPCVPRKREPSTAERFQQQATHCFRVLADYRNLLSMWRESCAPQTPTEEWHPLFVEALQELPQVEYWLDVLLGGSQEEKLQIVTEQTEKLPVLEKRIQAYREEKPASVMESLRLPIKSNMTHMNVKPKEAIL